MSGELRQRGVQVVVDGDVPEDYMPPEHHEFVGLHEEKRRANAPRWCRRKARDWFDEDTIDARTVHRLYTWMYRLAALGIGACLFYLAVLLIFGTSDSGTMEEVRYSHTHVRLRWGEFEAGNTSRAFTCSEILSDKLLYRGKTWLLSDVRERLEELHRAEPEDARLVCSCGAMFGFYMRYLVLENGTSPSSFTHALNPSLECNTHNLSVLTESQSRLLALEDDSTRRIARSNQCTLSYQRAGTPCDSIATLSLSPEQSWCAQACEDLFSGTTIYSKTEYNTWINEKDACA